MRVVDWSRPWKHVPHCTRHGGWRYTHWLLPPWLPNMAGKSCKTHPWKYICFVASSYQWCSVPSFTIYLQKCSKPPSVYRFVPMERVDLSSNSVSQTSSVQSSCPRKQKQIFQSISCVSGSIRWSHIIMLAVYYICPILSYDMFMKSLLEYDRLKWSKHSAWPLKDYIPIINAIGGVFQKNPYHEFLVSYHMPYIVISYHILW